MTERKGVKTYLKVHLDKLIRPFDKECSADIQMEIRKPLFFREISIPHPNRILNRDLPHQQTIHPPEAKLHEFHTLSFQMFRQPDINPGREVAQSVDLTHDTRLSKDVIILNAVQQLRETPEGIRFDGVEDRFGELAGIHAAFDIVVGDVAAEEDLPERGDEVVDSLDVAARWVPDRPDVEDAFEGALGGFVAVELEVRARAGDVDGDLVPECFVEAADAGLVCG